MPMPRIASLRASLRLRAALLIPVLILGCVGCGSSQPGPATATPSVSAIPTAAVPSPTPTPTPQPTPRYTNPPDAPLSALIPGRLGSAVVIKPPVTAFGETPGDLVPAFGELALRFESLAVGFVEKPRLSLYAIRVAPPAVAMQDLRPYLATAGQFVGINGVHPEAWRASVVGSKPVWTRGDDPATVVGTTLYCWTSGQYVFLLIGASDPLNRQMVTALPGLPRASPTPSTSSRPSGSVQASPSASG